MSEGDLTLDNARIVCTGVGHGILGNLGNLSVIRSSVYVRAVSGGEATIKKYAGPGGDVVIPSELGGFAVR